MGLALPNRTIVSLILLFGSVLSARAEVSTCKEITALPAIVNASGVWCLKKSLTIGGTTGIAIDVQAAAVTLDLNGFTITGNVGTTTQAVGIRSLNRRNVTIRNGTIRGFLAGISLEGTGSMNDVVEDMHVDQARQFGIRAQQTVQAVIRNNQVTNTGNNSIVGAVGIDIESAKFTTVSSNIVEGMTASFSTAGISAADSETTEIRDNSVLNIAGGASINTGISNSGSPFATIENNRLLNGITLGTTGISGGGVINCINNVIHRYTTATQCSFNSGNVTPPN